MRPLLFLLLLLLPNTALFAQGPPARVSKRWLEEQGPAAKQSLVDGFKPRAVSGYSFHLMPLSFVNRFSRARVGAQYRLQRFSFLFDYEFGGDWTNDLFDVETNRDYSFVGLRPEVRFFPSRYNDELYVGLEIPYTYLDRRVDGSFIRTDGSRISVENARQQRERLSFIAKLGVQLVIGRHFLLDLYAGGGMAYRRALYTDADSARTTNPFLIDDIGIFGNGLMMEGRRIVPELALGFRVGCWLGR